MPTFVHDDHRIAYSERGSGPNVVVLIHGLLFSKKLVAPLASQLGQRGYRVITVDLLGHGDSDRPPEMWKYSMTAFGEQVIGLLDHLEVDQAVVGGMSLGANTALEAAAFAPERIRGLIVEMPVLDNALIGCAIAFTPLMVAMTFGQPVLRGISAIAKRIPTRRGPYFADVMLDLVRQDPRPSAAVLQGLFFARIAPPGKVRRTLGQPALVIGHQRDPVHPFSDSGALVDEMENARLVEAKSILELRIAPRRLTDEIARFLDGVFSDTGKRETPAAPRARVA
jgi:pimeloyl-ACP methyl ester carboxylesterase